jgi:hypothetical protein
VACIGALSLAEQYYPPLWYLPALAAALPAAGLGASTADTADGRPGDEPVAVPAHGAYR